MESCNYFNRGICRSCTLLGLSYAEQLKRKRDTLAESFAAAGLECEVQALIPSDVTLASRNKAKMAVGGTVSNPLLGFTSSECRVIDIPACPLHISPIPQILAELQKLISEFSLQPYDISAQRGELKFVLVRSSETTSETYVRLVLRSREQLDAARAALVKLQATFSQVVVTSVNIQPVPQAIIEGAEEILISERDFIVDSIAGKQLVFSPQSFSQVTSNVAAKLYLFVAEVVRAAAIRKLLDLYCGVGAFSIVCASFVEQSFGVEISSQAIENARRSVTLNALGNLRYEAADVEKFLKSHADLPDAIIVNPPRRGLSKSVIEDVRRITPRLIVYSSCYPDSLLRDLKLLQPDYSIAQVRPFDMFPLTAHVETVVVLERI